mgnify:CR=1 FL=1
MTARVGVALALMFACTPRREAPQARAVTTTPADAPAIALPPPPPDAAVACPWSWSPDSALALEAPPEGMAFDWAVACPVGHIAVALRTGTHLAVRSRALEHDARWSDAITVADDVASLGQPGIAAGTLWVAWLTTTRTLRAARVDERAHPVEGMAPPLDGTWTDPRVLDAHADRALLAAGYHRAQTDRVVLLRLGLGASMPARATLADGTIAATAPGPRRRVYVLTRDPQAQGGPWTLRALDIDATLALAMAGSGANAFSALPEGAVSSSAALGVGPGHFEFAAPTREGTVLFQTAVGAERGAARLAWFGDAAAPAMVTLPLAPSALGDVFDDASGGRRATATWWSDEQSPTRATVTPDGIVASAVLGPAARDARAALSEARDTRLVWCGNVPWRIRATRGTGHITFHASRVACEAPTR